MSTLTIWCQTDGCLLRSHNFTAEQHAALSALRVPPTPTVEPPTDADALRAALRECDAVLAANRYQPTGSAAKIRVIISDALKGLHGVGSVEAASVTFECHDDQDQPMEVGGQPINMKTETEELRERLLLAEEAARDKYKQILAMSRAWEETKAELAALRNAAPVTAVSLWPFLIRTNENLRDVPEEIEPKDLIVTLTIEKLESALSDMACVEEP